MLSWWPPCSRNPTDWLHLPAGLSGQERRVVVVRRRRRSRTSTPSRWRTGGRRAWSTSTTTSALLPEARRARRPAVRVDGRHHLCVQRCRPRTRWCPCRHAATAARRHRRQPPLRPAQHGERVRHLLGDAAAADHLTAKRLVFSPLHCITRKGITNTGLDREKTHTVTCSSYQWSTVIFDKHLLFCSLFLLMFIITRQRSLLRSGCCRSPTLQHISGQSWVAFCRGHCVHSWSFYSAKFVKISAPKSSYALIRGRPHEALIILHY